MSAADLLIALLAAVVALAGTSLMAAADACVGILPRGRARRLAEAGTGGGRELERLAEAPERLMAAHALVAVASGTLIAAVGTWALIRALPDVPGGLWALAATLAGAVVLFALAEALPRTLALTNPERVGLAAAPAAATVTSLAWPVAAALSAPWRWFVAVATHEPSGPLPWSDGEVSRSRAEDEAGEATDSELIDAVEDLGSKIVREVMVPRTDMVCIEDTATLQEAVATITGAGFSRLPVYHDTLDDITGILYAKDLLGYLAAGRDVRPRDIARAAVFVPETKPVQDLLREMRRRAHLAIVADEYGGTSGLVTIEDLLEEIVGEIYDEYDPQVVFIVEGEDGATLIDARLTIDDLNEHLGTAFDPEADTAGGLFTELAGHIPVAGESVEAGGVRFTVREMQGTRVRQLEVEPAPAADEEPHDD